MELLGRQNGYANGHSDDNSSQGSGRVRRFLEKSWPIDEHLKLGNSESLFQWIGQCIAMVIEAGCKEFHLPADAKLPLGVTFSFPSQQTSLSEALIKPMGKGFALESGLDLGASIRAGYTLCKADHLPDIEVAAIANDSVSTLVSFIYNYDASEKQRASMGLILGTGSNATVPLKLSRLHESKWPQSVSVLDGESAKDARIAVNTEWSIKGTAPPMRDLGIITKWDDLLSAQNETPGFQPLEYMTAGRYLGELGRIMLVDYMTNELKMPVDTLPKKLLQRHTLTTTFLSHFRPFDPLVLLTSLRSQFPESSGKGFAWTRHLAEALYRITKGIQYRAAGIIASAILALLTLADEVPAEASTDARVAAKELGVGYTGGCIIHFQDYLEDTQWFVDQLLAKRFNGSPPAKVVLSPCHDGGISGAGILVAAALSSKNADMS